MIENFILSSIAGFILATSLAIIVEIYEYFKNK